MLTLSKHHNTGNKAILCVKALKQWNRKLRQETLCAVFWFKKWISSRVVKVVVVFVVIVVIVPSWCVVDVVGGEDDYGI